MLGMPKYSRSDYYIWHAVGNLGHYDRSCINTGPARLEHIIIIIII